MKKVLPKILAILIVVLACVCVFAACSSTPKTRADAVVTLLSTNDIHGNVAGDEEAVIGMVKAAEIKASTPNAILIDAGDATQGASFASIGSGGDVIRMMNAAGYDVMAAGNHDFDYGTQTLLANAEAASFPILAANVKKDGEDMLPGSAIVERAGYKIGFIGLTTVSTATSTNPTLLQGVTFEDEIATAKAEIAEIKDKTDAIVLVCHMGDNAAAVSCTSEQLLNGFTDAELKEVTAVIDGHSHTVEDLTVKGVPVVQTGLNFANIGKVTLSFKDNKGGASVTAQADIIDFAAASAFEATQAGKAKGEAVSTALEQIVAEQSAILNESLGVLDHPLFGGYVCYDFVESRAVETSYGDFVTDAFKYYAEQFAANNAITLPVVAVENGGGISQSLPTWSTNGTKMTVGDVLNAFNHGNLVDVLKVSPAELFAAIEKGLAATGQDAATGRLEIPRVSGSFLQCSGFSYEYDPAGETGAKVTEVKLADGTVLDRADAQNKILLATNNYVSSSFPNSEKLGELGGEDMLIVDYIKHVANGGVLDYDCAYDRIKIHNDLSPDTYTVTVEVKNADKTACANSQVVLTIDGEQQQTLTTDGEGKLTVTLSKGAHYLKLANSTNFVYVNNYSGTGLEYTKDGYYTFAFLLA